MLQTFSKLVVKLWNEWEVRGLVLTSLLLQTVLIICGCRRKYSTRVWLRVVVWMTYLSADWVATVALGMISNFQGDQQENYPHPNSHIMAFWAPFLLVHLGGPDTITAYSLEDNELWLRHLLGLIVQVGVAVYIFVRSWTKSNYPYLSLLSIPMYVAGIIKYGERTWVLRYASTGRFRDSFLPDTTTRSLDFVTGKARGVVNSFVVNNVPQSTRHLHEAFLLFTVLKHLYADVMLDYNDGERCYKILEEPSPEDVFKLLEIELGFMYDVLYTKASILYTLTGIIFRSISLVCYMSTVLVFFLFIDKQLYSSIDIDVTYLLVVGAIALELYAIISLVPTDRTLYLLSKQKHPLSNQIYKAVSSFRSTFSYGKRWSGSMAQFNLIEFCLSKEKRHKCAEIQSLLGIYQMFEKYWYTTQEEVPIKMKELIFMQLKDTKRVVGEGGHDVVRKILTWRGNHVLQKSESLEMFNWSVADHVPCEESILIWHIATDLCYYYDLGDKPDGKGSPSSKLSRLLSNYMAYIVFICPSMFPTGMGQTRFHDMCAEIIASFGIKKYDDVNARRLCKVLYGRGTKLVSSSASGRGTLLFKVCKLADQLQTLELKAGWTKEKKWEMITQVWIEMLCYVANQCGWIQHAQQLRRGGELLTHVSLLMTNLGLSERFQIQERSEIILRHKE